MRFSFVLARSSLIFLLIWMQQAVAQPAAVTKNTLKPFTTDGCSVWIDGTPKRPYLWRHCCVAHDKAYWVGGAEHLRVAADKALQACVVDLAGAGMANYMYFFVNTGGSPLWLTPYRWGYGWDYMDGGKPRGYKLLTESEQIQVNALMPQTEQIIAEDAVKYSASATVWIGK